MDNTNTQNNSNLEITQNTHDAAATEKTELPSMDDNQKSELKNHFSTIVDGLRSVYFEKAKALLIWIPEMLHLNYQSYKNRLAREANANKLHPVRPVRGQIFNAFLGVNLGSELSDNHLVVIIQNDRNNPKGEKVNVLPIEGDGNNSKNYHVKIANDDLVDGRLDKDPSKIIVGDITTIDKARLGRKIGKLNDTKMLEIERKLKRQLGM